MALIDGAMASPLAAQTDRKREAPNLGYSARHIAELNFTDVFLDAM